MNDNMNSQYDDDYQIYNVHSGGNMDENSGSSQSESSHHLIIEEISKTPPNSADEMDDNLTTNTGHNHSPLTNKFVRIKRARGELSTNKSNSSQSTLYDTNTSQNTSVNISTEKKGKKRKREDTQTDTIPQLHDSGDDNGSCGPPLKKKKKTDHVNDYFDKVFNKTQKKTNTKNNKSSKESTKQSKTKHNNNAQQKPKSLLQVVISKACLDRGKNGEDGDLQDTLNQTRNTKSGPGNRKNNNTNWKACMLNDLCDINDSAFVEQRKPAPTIPPDVHNFNGGDNDTNSTSAPNSQKNFCFACAIVGNYGSFSPEKYVALGNALSQGIRDPSEQNAKIIYEIYRDHIMIPYNELFEDDPNILPLPEWEISVIRKHLNNEHMTSYASHLTSMVHKFSVLMQFMETKVLIQQDKETGEFKINEGQAKIYNEFAKNKMAALKICKSSHIYPDGGELFGSGDIKEPIIQSYKKQIRLDSNHFDLLKIKQ